MTVPQPMAVDGETTHDPATRSVLVRVSGVGASYWRRGHAALMQAEEAGSYVHGLCGRMRLAAARLREVSRCGMGGCGSSSATPTYRRLVGAPGLAAIVTVGRDAAQILGVKFRRRES